MKIQFLKALFSRTIFLLSLFSLTVSSNFAFAHGSHPNVESNSLTHFLMHLSPYIVILLVVVIGYRLWKKYGERKL